MYDNMRQHVITCDNLHFDSICFPCFLFLKGRLTTYQTDDDDNKLRVRMVIEDWQIVSFVFAVVNVRQ